MSGGGAGASGGGAGGNDAGGGGGVAQDCRTLGCPAGEYCRIAELYVCPSGFSIEQSGRCVPFENDCDSASACDCVNETCTPARCSEQDGAVEVVCWEGCWG